MLCIICNDRKIQIEVKQMCKRCYIREYRKQKPNYNKESKRKNRKNYYDAEINWHIKNPKQPIIIKANNFAHIHFVKENKCQWNGCIETKKLQFAHIDYEHYKNPRI